jgi:hypothetical protein
MCITNNVFFVGDFHFEARNDLAARGCWCGRWIKQDWSYGRNISRYTVNVLALRLLRLHNQ